MKPFFASQPCVRVIAARLFVAGTLSFFGCRQPTLSSRTPAAIPVQTAQATKETVSVAQNAIGTVQPLRTVAMKSQVDGVIAAIHFREGDGVMAGDLLISLDRRPFENSLRSAQADLANARAEADEAETQQTRYQNLNQQAAISKEQFAQYQTKVETTKAIVQAKEAAVANARLQLGYTEIRAPIPGRTGQLSLHEGALVKANDTGQSIVLINQLEPITVAYAIPETTLGAVRAALSAGQVLVTARPRGQDESVVEGKLDFVDNTVDPTTGTILLKAIFSNSDGALWPGQFVDVVTRIGVEHDAIVVPAAAVQVGQSGSQIFVVKDDGTVELRMVSLGRTIEGKTTIRQGVKAGETVVTDGQLRLVPGVKVEAKTLAEAVPVAATESKPLASSRSPKS